MVSAGSISHSLSSWHEQKEKEDNQKVQTRRHSHYNHLQEGQLPGIKVSYKTSVWSGIHVCLMLTMVHSEDICIHIYMYIYCTCAYINFLFFTLKIQPGFFSNFSMQFSWLCEELPVCLHFPISFPLLLFTCSILSIFSPTHLPLLLSLSPFLPCFIFLWILALFSFTKITNVKVYTCMSNHGCDIYPP